MKQDEACSLQWSATWKQVCALLRERDPNDGTHAWLRVGADGLLRATLDEPGSEWRKLNPDTVAELEDLSEAVDPLHERAREAITRLGLDGSRFELAVTIFGWGSDEANGSLLGLVRDVFSTDAASLDVSVGRSDELVRCAWFDGHDGDDREAEGLTELLIDALEGWAAP